MRRLIFILIAANLLPVLAMAKDVAISGTYGLVLPSDMSESEGRTLAVEKAILQALADEFGTVVAAEAWLDIRSDGAESADSFWQLGTTLVKGEWICHTREPEIVKSIAGSGETVITARVWGKARAIESPKAEIEAYVSAPGAGAAQKRFANGSRFTLHFRSAAQGYVAVFLIDENDDVCRLLPYAGDGSAAVAVNAMEQYEFFASQKGMEEQYELRIGGEDERTKARNVIYVVFSTRPYARPLDEYYKDRGLRILTRRAFMEWLGKQRGADGEMSVKMLPVEIVRRL